MRFASGLFLLGLAATAADLRNISLGPVIPDEAYADQPYVVKTDDGAWLCVLTTGRGREGEGGQHVISLRSSDRGRTWQPTVEVEPANGPEASYAVLLKAPGGRVYVFYNHNSDNLREVIADKPAFPTGTWRRVDSLGHFVFKYSDDHGRSWSARRYDIPQRDFAIDRQNPYGGKLKFFWNVGKPFVLRGAAYVPLIKIGGFGEGGFTSTEGVLLRSPNLLTERDPERVTWETLPDGDAGIRTPAGGGPVAEEQSYSVLSDGSLFCVFRTIDGYPARTYSRDGGRTWEPPEYMRYADGRRMKHPRAANFAWRCGNGRYLYWFHNHGGRFIAEHPQRRSFAYRDRNPVWLAAGEEVDSPRGKILRWSQPEIALYDDDPRLGISYPDLVEDDGYFVTETQKEIARVHEVSVDLLSGLWSQFTAANVPRDGLVLEATGPGTAKAPAMPSFVQRAGLTLALRVKLDSIEPGRVLVDNRTAQGKGFALLTAPGAAVELILNDGRTENRWTSDPGTLAAGRSQHIAAIIDAGPRVISFVIDGRLNDGGEHRQFGWGRFSPHLREVDGAAEVRVGGGVEILRLYQRHLRTSEAVAISRVP